MAADLVIHHFPGACSQVSITALEEAGLAYSVALVNLKSGEQSRPEYLALSPLGKVPLLMIDGHPLTENPAILTYIAAIRPEAGLFPAGDDALVRAEIVRGLSLCASGLHPAVRGIAVPSRLTTGEEAPVREKALELAHKAFSGVEQRLARSGWWFEDWSIIDVYLEWAFKLAVDAGFDGSAFPGLTALQQRLTCRPAFSRMLDRDAEARRQLGL